MSSNAKPTPSSPKKNANRLSKDGRWRSFPRVPHLLQYVKSETYFARIKIGGRIIRESLETSVWTVAQLKLVDFLKQKRENGLPTPTPGILFEKASELFLCRVKSDASMKTSSKDYRVLCVGKLRST